MPTTISASPERQRQRLQIREHEILRLQAELTGMPPADLMQRARRTSLTWASKRTTGTLPSTAWRYESFDHLAVGRNCSAIRLISEVEDIWTIRSEDPDKNVADRVWTTEITVSQVGESCFFHLRLLTSSREIRPDIDPAVPVVVRQLLTHVAMKSGIATLNEQPWIISSENDAKALLVHLCSPARVIPTIILSVSAWASDEIIPLIPADALARSLLGLATIVVLPAKFTWVLTRELGKALSVYEGAARIYLPGFTENANPYEGHELILASRLINQADIALAARKLKWIVALYSVRSSPSTRSIRPFTTVRTMQLSFRQTSLEAEGASDREQLEAAKAGIEALRQELKESTEQVQWLSDEHDQAELRAKYAEEQNRRNGFRIQQLSAQLRDAGEAPDAKINLPKDWDGFEDWCDEHLAGRVLLAPQARRALSSPDFNNPEIAAKCLLWLANEYIERRVAGGAGSLRDVVVLEGIRNSPCGSDTYSIQWQGEKQEVEWHIKNGGNTRDRSRCLRIYYFWDISQQQVVVTYLPAHRNTDAS